MVEYKIKTGVIGVGNMGGNHTRVLNNISNLHGVSDLNSDLLTSVSKKYEIKAYSNYLDLLDNVDAVVISTPTQSHLEISLEAAKRGVNFLVEKPIAFKVKDAEKIIKAAEKNNVVLSVGHIERYNPVVRKVKDLLDSGEYGDIFTINTKRVSHFPERIKDVGIIHDLGVHDIDIVTYLSNSEIKNINAACRSAKNDHFEDYSTLMLEFKNGIIANCELSWLTPFKQRKLTINTDKYFIEADYINQELNVFSSNLVKFTKDNQFITEFQENKEKISVKIEEPLKLELSDFLQSILRNKTPLVTGKDGLNAIRIANRVLKIASNE